MKNKLLLLAVVLLATLISRAVTNIEEGVDYYILNVETDLFLGAQNNWGTNSAISTDAGIFQFVPGATGEGYNIVNTLISVTNKNLGTNLYTDNNGLATVIDDEGAGTDAEMREYLDSKSLAIRWAAWILLFVAVLLFGIYGPGYDPTVFIYREF